MKFGVFYEHQLPRPWGDDDEQNLLRDALEQLESADSLGYDYAWAVEHHFLEEYSHCSAPEVFLGAASQRTKRIRLGHGVVLMPSPFNHPARVAERIATLDLISNGRVEFGTGECSSRTELEGFGVDPAQKRAMWTESVRQVCRMMTEEPYGGFSGQWLNMPPRNVVPKPAQKPHPPMWLACSNRDSIRRAARLGLGALTFAFIDPEEAKYWVDDYYTAFKEDCTPIGMTVNPNIVMVIDFSCHENQTEAERRGMEGAEFFKYALEHYYVSGEQVPGRTDIWSAFQKARGTPFARGAIGTPDKLRRYLRACSEAGLDQVGLIPKSGNNRHEHVLASLDLFAKKVMPTFKAEEAERQATKRAALAPFIARAMARVEGPRDPGDLAAIPAYGRAPRPV